MRRGNDGLEPDKLNSMVLGMILFVVVLLVLSGIMSAASHVVANNYPKAPTTNH